MIATYLISEKILPEPQARELKQQMQQLKGEINKSLLTKIKQVTDKIRNLYKLLKPIPMDI